MKNTKRIWIIGVIIVLLFPFNVFAKDIFSKEIKVGPVKIKTSLNATAEYNSNVDLKTKDLKGSMVYRITPGLSFGLPVPLLASERTYAKVDADVNYVDVERGHTTWTGHGKGLLRYSFSNLTSLGLCYDYSSGELYGPDSGNTFGLADATGMIKHQFSPRLAVAIGGGQEKYDTHIKPGSSPFTDYNEYKGNVTIDYTLSPSTTLTLTGDYADRDYKDVEQKEYKAGSGTLGITRRVTQRLTIGGYGGYTQRDYKVSEDAKEITYGANLNFIPSAFSTLSIKYSHSLQDTFYPKDPEALPNPFGRDEVLVDLLNEDFRYLQTDSVSLNLGYRLSDKDSLDIGGEYTLSKSGQDLGSLVSSDLRAHLKEHNYYGGMGYSHKFASWCALDIKGTYGVRTSNLREKYDYWTGGGGLKISF